MWAVANAGRFYWNSRGNMPPKRKPKQLLPPLKKKKVLAEGYGKVLICTGEVDDGSKIEITVRIEDKRTDK